MKIMEQVFIERLQEIETYLDFLQSIEAAVQDGPPQIGLKGTKITAEQLRILYSSVYIQLYNLVEATITKCIESVCEAITDKKNWKPSDLSDKLRREWVRFLARTHTDLTYENRLKNSISMFDHLIQSLPVNFLEIERGGGGNWNDDEISRIADRIGCTLNLSPACKAAVKRPFKDDKGALALIVKLRNDLAHGSVSFGQCGEGATVNELRKLTKFTGDYLNEVVASFVAFINDHSFLQQTCKPAPATTI